MNENKKDFFAITVKAVVLNEKNEVLLIKRPKKDYYGAGSWDFPGGKLEAGEDLEEGLKREIMEETGIEAKIGPVIFIKDFEKKYNDKFDFNGEEVIVNGKGIRFVAYYESGEIKLSDEHEKYEWVDLDKAAEKFGQSDFEKDKIEALKKAQEFLEKERARENWKRMAADFENYKKRQEEARKDIIAFSNQNMILEILPVLDNFHASTEHIPEEQKNSPWVVGIMHIQKQLEKILEDNGVSEIKIKIGDEFDPENMEAIKQEAGDSEQESKGKVKKVLQKGYKIGGKVIRAARVVVE